MIEQQALSEKLGVAKLAIIGTFLLYQLYYRKDVYSSKWLPHPDMETPEIF